MTKKCCKCDKEKQLTCFHKQKASSDGHKSWCKECTRAYDRINKQKNQEKIKEQQKKYRKKHKEHLNEQRKIWGSNNPEKVKANAKKYRKNNKDKINEKRKQKRHNNINFKLRTSISNRIRMAIERGSKNTSSINLIGCSIEKLKTHLEKQFTDGMSWDNYGEWHIDHIKPCCSFDLSKESEQKQCFHYSNMQPLWALDNLKKSGKFFT